MTDPRFRLYFFALDGVCDACAATKPHVIAFRDAHPEIELLAYDLTETKWPEEGPIQRLWKRLRGAAPSPQPPDVVPSLILVERRGDRWTRPAVLAGQTDLAEIEVWFKTYQGILE